MQSGNKTNTDHASSVCTFDLGLCILQCHMKNSACLVQTLVYLSMCRIMKFAEHHLIIYLFIYLLIVIFLSHFYFFIWTFVQFWSVNYSDFGQ